MHGRIRTTGRGSASRGITLVEMMVVLVVVSIGWLALTAVSIETMRTFEFFQAMNLLERWNQSVVNNIRDDAVSAKQYFGDDDRGRGYFGALEKDSDSYPISPVRLPTIVDTGNLGVDSLTDQKTGNVLLFSKALMPFVVTVPYTDSEDHTYRVNIHQLTLYYLTSRPQERVGNYTGVLDLMRWQSVRFADYGQIMAIEDPDAGDGVDPREEMVAAFVDAYNSTWLWDSGKDVSEAFYECDLLGQVADEPELAMIIRQDPVGGLISTVPSGMTTSKHASIAWNNSTAGFQVSAVVPVYALEDAFADGFPHGFEVQIVGPSGARELMVRVVMTKGTTKRIISRESTAILTSREF